MKCVEGGEQLLIILFGYTPEPDPKLLAFVRAFVTTRKVQRNPESHVLLTQVVAGWMISRIEAQPVGLFL